MSKTLSPGINIVMPYLIIPNAPGFLQFVKDVFGAQELHRVVKDNHTVQHAPLAIKDRTIMLAKASDDYPLSQPTCLFM